jgi:hypothetical protein
MGLKKFDVNLWVEGWVKFEVEAFDLNDAHIIADRMSLREALKKSKQLTPEYMNVETIVEYETLH